MIAISLLLWGCGASQALTKTDAQEAAESSRAKAANAKIEVSGISSAVTEISQGQVVSTVTTYYDTDKPVDPVTGTPPIKKKQEQNIRTDINLRKDEQAEGQTQANISATDDQKAKVDREQHNETASRRGLNWWQMILCGCGALSLLFLGLKLALKRIKTPF